MAKSSRPTLGFDRYIPLDWAHYALDLAIAEPDQKSLKTWLESQMAGKDAARKTANLLANLWLNSFAETAQLRQQALALAPQLARREWVVLHWGMSTTNFPFFRSMAASMGRLLRIQGNFRSPEIRQRMLEIYSNQGSVPRLVNRFLQTLCNWQVLSSSENNLYTAAPAFLIESPQLTTWLFEAALIGQGGVSLPISDLIRLPELFPFDLPATAMTIVRGAPNFVISREGLDREMVALGAHP